MEHPKELSLSERGLTIANYPCLSTVEKFLISLRRLPEIWLVDFLSNVLGLSEKTTLTFIGRLSSNDFCILCIILKTCELQVSPGRKPDGQTLKSSFSIKSQTMTWISSFYYYLYII